MRSTIVAAVVAALFAVGCSDDDSEPGADDRAERTVLAVGETVDADGATATVYAVEAPITEPPTWQDTPEEFAAVDVEACVPDGAEPTTLPRDLFDLVMADNSRGVAMGLSQKTPAWKWDTTLDPGRCLRGWITYQVSPGVAAVAVETDLYRWQVR